MKKQQRSPKLQGIIDLVKQAANKGNYRYTHHAQERCQLRKVNRAEVSYTLKNGYHEARKDEYQPDKGGWNYSIRCYHMSTERDIRVAIAFDEQTRMFLITVIAIGEKDG